MSFSVSFHRFFFSPPTLSIHLSCLPAAGSLFSIPFTIPTVQCHTFFGILRTFCLSTTFFLFSPPFSLSVGFSTSFCLLSSLCQKASPSQTVQTPLHHHLQPMLPLLLFFRGALTMSIYFFWCPHRCRHPRTLASCLLFWVIGLDAAVIRRSMSFLTAYLCWGGGSIYTISSARHGLCLRYFAGCLKRSSSSDRQTDTIRYTSR